MSNFGLATKHAFKDFFKRQADHSDFKKVAKNYSVWHYDELIIISVFAGIHQHSFGIPGSIMQAVKEGRWKYHDLKEIEMKAPEILQNSPLSPAGKKLVMKMMRRGKYVDSQRFSREDAKILQQYIDDINGRRTGMVNF